MSGRVGESELCYSGIHESCDGCVCYCHPAPSSPSGNQWDDKTVRALIDKLRSLDRDQFDEVALHDMFVEDICEALESERDRADKAEARATRLQELMVDAGRERDAAQAVIAEALTIEELTVIATLTKVGRVLRAADLSALQNRVQETRKAVIASFEELAESIHAAEAPEPPYYVGQTEDMFGNNDDMVEYGMDAGIAWARWSDAQGIRARAAAYREGKN